MTWKLTFTSKTHYYHTTINIENGSDKRTNTPPQVEIANILCFQILGEQNQQKNKCINISIKNRAKKKTNTLPQVEIANILGF